MAALAGWEEGEPGSFAGGVGVSAGLDVAVGGGVGVGYAAVSARPTVGGAELHAANGRARRVRTASGRNRRECTRTVP